MLLSLLITHWIAGVVGQLSAVIGELAELYSLVEIL